MLFKRRPLNCILIMTTAIAAVSCIENDRTMGQGLLPDKYLLSLGVKTFDLPVTMAESDSVQSANSSNMIVGTMSDPVFGTVTANSASYILPYSDSTDFGENPELVSAYLNLTIDSTYYLNSNQSGIHQRIRIYKLTSPIDSTMGFCNSITPDKYDPDPVSVSDPVIYGSGSIKIDLKDEFAQELLDTTPEEFADLNLFLERIYGLYIEVEEPMNTESGGRLNYMSLGYSTITLNYILTDPDRGISDLDTTESFAFGYYTAFNNFSTTSSHLAGTAPGDSLFLEGLSGVKPHISALELRDMIDNWIEEDSLQGYTMILSRAELVFPYEMPSDYERFDKEHPASIYAFTNVPWASDTLRFFNPLSEIYSISNRGAINRSTLQYSMDITAYLQNLVLMERDEIDASMDLWIAPLYTRTGTYSTYYEFDNGNYNKIILNGPTAERRPVLNLTYALMEQ